MRERRDGSRAREARRRSTATAGRRLCALQLTYWAPCSSIPPYSLLPHKAGRQMSGARRSTWGAGSSRLCCMRCWPPGCGSRSAAQVRLTGRAQPGAYNQRPGRLMWTQFCVRYSMSRTKELQHHPSCSAEQYCRHCRRPGPGVPLIFSRCSGHGPVDPPPPGCVRGAS